MPCLHWSQNLDKTSFCNSTTICSFNAWWSWWKLFYRGRNKEKEEGFSLPDYFCHSQGIHLRYNFIAWLYIKLTLCRKVCFASGYCGSFCRWNLYGSLRISDCRNVTNTASLQGTQVCIVVLISYVDIVQN